MCCIAVCQKKRLTPELLKDMYDTNNHGVGIAWIKKGKVIWRKGNNIKQIEILCGKVPLPYIVHTRMASIGGQSVALAHPFPIERKPALSLHGTAHRVLMHNGHIIHWDELMAVVSPEVDTSKGNWSDSRAVAHLIACNGTRILNFFKGGNRFVVLSAKDILIVGNWHEKDDYQFSTLPYKRTTTYYPGAYQGVNTIGQGSKLPEIPKYSSEYSKKGEEDLLDKRDRRVAAAIAKKLLKEERKNGHSNSTALVPVENKPTIDASATLDAIINEVYGDSGYG